MVRIVVAFCFVALASSANAGVCPAQSPQDKFRIVSAAPSCREAARLFKFCAIGSAFDGALALRVSENCERRGLDRLSSVRRKTYEAARKACNAQFSDKQGSLFRSRAAFCHVGAMEKFAKPR